MSATAHLLTVAYVGTAYAGWQRQDNGQATIQGELEKVVTQIWGEPYHVEGSGRTDTGVHALGQTAGFCAPQKLDSEALRRAFNFHLPRDIRVSQVVFREPTFHARFDVAQKTYEYRLWQHAYLDPFMLDRVWHVPQELNLKQMQQAALLLVGTHDFAALATNSGNPKSTTVRQIIKLSLIDHSPLLRLRVTADGFLYHMVRNIVGALVQIGKGKLTVSAFAKILREKNRSLAPASAPAYGLYLKSVRYRPRHERVRRVGKKVKGYLD
jgi:tRNA pseudouridine38-40 synthase